MPPRVANYDPNATGNPALTDVGGVRFAFVVDQNGDAVMLPTPCVANPGYETGFEFSVNDIPLSNGAFQMIICQGRLYYMGTWVGGKGRAQGWYQYGAGGFHKLPPALDQAPSRKAGAGQMPADPPKPVIAPGSSGRTILYDVNKIKGLGIFLAIRV